MRTEPASDVSMAPDLPPLIMGGAGFSSQLNADPESLPVKDILERAFEKQLRAIDTSPYYEPSEQLIGAALSHEAITKRYDRSSYVLMTKAGRISDKEFDYSPQWIRQSVERSMQRLHTSYLDVVFCHDVEFVTTEEALAALGALFELKAQGSVRMVGISGYPLDVLVDIATKALETYGQPIDVAQTWAQLTLQNTNLQRNVISALKRVGVRNVCSSSPLAVGLLRRDGVPVGTRGDWHPAPSELRQAARRAADFVAEQSDDLSALSLRFAIASAVKLSDERLNVATVIGVGSMTDLEKNMENARQVLDYENDRFGSGDTSLSQGRMPRPSLKAGVVKRDTQLVSDVRAILGQWVNYDFIQKSQL